MEITIDGKKYKLIPIEEDNTERVDDSFLEDYKVSEGPKIIKKAIPKLSDYRERFKQHKVRGDEVRTEPKVYSKVGQVNAEMAKFGDLVIGEGLTQEF